MKNLFLTAIFSLITIVSFSQDNFKWDKIDSTTKSKDEIYTLTKMYIAETWYSAQNVIQNDDKENGTILIKGVNVQSHTFQLNNHVWNFNYTVKFQFKENKYRIIIDNVHCTYARCAQYDWPLMPVSDTYPTEKGFKLTSLNEIWYLKIMGHLKTDLQSIVDGYENYINKNNTTINTDW
jgi:hypothetical protein